MFKIPENLFCEMVSGSGSSLGSLQVSKDFSGVELTETINSLLESEGLQTSSLYRFFVNGKLLQSDLSNHMSKHGIHGEGKIQIVFEEGVPEPKIGKRIEFKDWVRKMSFLGSGENSFGVVGLFSGRVAILDRSFKQVGLIEKSRVCYIWK